MSTKFCASLSMKYSSAMLRPPTTAITPSAMKSLLCMRWLSRPISCGDAAKRERKPSRPQQNGLNSRTSTLGVCESASSRLLALGGVEVVHQQAHPHAARRGLAQRAQQQPAGGSFSSW